MTTFRSRQFSEPGTDVRYWEAFAPCEGCEKELITFVGETEDDVRNKAAHYCEFLSHTFHTGGKMLCLKCSDNHHRRQSMLATDPETFIYLDEFEMAGEEFMYFHGYFETFKDQIPIPGGQLDAFDSFTATFADTNMTACRDFGHDFAADTDPESHDESYCRRCGQTWSY